MCCYKNIFKEFWCECLAWNCFCYVSCACTRGFNFTFCVFRVKELGPGGPVEGKPAELPINNNIKFGAMSPQNSDLALLKTSNVRYTCICNSQSICIVKKAVASVNFLVLHLIQQ